MIKNQNGFALAGMLLVLICSIVIVFVGWVVFDASRNSPSVTSLSSKYSETTKDAPVQTPKPKDAFGVQNLASENTSGWKTFNYPERFYSFKYPPDWQFRDFGTYHTTQADSKITSSSQRITSPAGIHDREYPSYEAIEAKEGGFPGTQILVGDTYDPDHPRATTKDCRQDFYDYYFLRQITTRVGDKTLNKCLFQRSDRSYDYTFNAGEQYFNIRLYFGGKSTEQQRREAAQTFVNIGESFRYTGPKL